MSPKIVDKNTKKEGILRAAMKVFGRRGVNDFRMIEIAREAEVGKGTLYEYFTSKEDLILACFELFLHDYNVFLEEKLTGVSDPAEQMRRFIHGSFDFFSINKEQSDILFDFYAAGIPRKDGEPLLAGLQQSYGEAIQHLASIIECGIEQGCFRQANAQTVASMLLAQLDGILFQVTMGLQRIEDKSLAEETCRLFFERMVK